MPTREDALPAQDSLAVREAVSVAARTRLASKTRAAAAALKAVVRGDEEVPTGATPRTATSSPVAGPAAFSLVLRDISQSAATNLRKMRSPQHGSKLHAPPVLSSDLQGLACSPRVRHMLARAPSPPPAGAQGAAAADHEADEWALSI